MTLEKNNRPKASTEKIALETLDIEKVVQQDIDSAIYFLSFVRDNKDVLDILVQSLEEIKQQAIKTEAEMDKQLILNGLS